MQRIKLVLLALSVFALCSCATNSPAPVAATASPSPSSVTSTSTMSTEEMEKMIIDLEKKSWEPVINQSPEEAKRFNAPDYRAIYFGAIHYGDESANDTKDIVIKRISFSDWKVSFPVKGTAIVTYKYEAVSTYKGKDTSGMTIATTTWVNIGSEWKQAVYAETRAEPKSKK